MVSETLKRDIHLPKNKEFFWNLSELPSTDKKGLKSLLNAASAGQLLLLIKLIHALLNGHVSIKKVHFERIKVSRKLPFLRETFEDKEEYRRLKNSSTTVQRKVLQKINVYHELFFYLFSLP